MALNFSRLDNNTTIVKNPWHDVKISETTQKHRNQLKSGIDDFASFTWRGIDAFEVFGAFIINDKNSLKFYNGPTYSNSYTKPQFDSAYGQLTGVTFNVQKIDFKIGVYWISEHHYRRLINWLNPYEINTLTFGFEPDYFYQVKLASIEDGTRYIVGRESIANYDYLAGNADAYQAYIGNPDNINNIVAFNGHRQLITGRYTVRNLSGAPEIKDNEPMYYTEMKLSFEIQGPACAYHRARYECEEIDHGTPEREDDSSSVYYITSTYTFSDKQEAPNSDMAVPIEATIRTKLYGDVENQDNLFFNIFLEAQYGDNALIPLFDISFKNQTFSANNPQSLDIKYESESGLLLLNVGDSEYVLLNQLSTSNYGKRIVDSIIVNHFEVPGLFDDCQFDMLSNLTFKITIRSNATTDSNKVLEWLDQADFNIRARTNLI